MKLELDLELEWGVVPLRVTRNLTLVIAWPQEYKQGLTPKNFLNYGLNALVVGNHDEKFGGKK